MRKCREKKQATTRSVGSMMMVRLTGETERRDCRGPHSARIVARAEDFRDDDAILGFVGDSVTGRRPSLRYGNK
jgi:hypothetical protein